jgi:hypothetical protein
MSNEKPFKLDMPFSEALKRFARVGKPELAEAIGADVDKQNRVRKRIKEAEEEIQRGARSGKPKFRP